MKHAIGGPLGEKFSRLLSLLKDSGDAALAFSGGVDSSFLLKAMSLSGRRFIAVTAVSETTPEWDLADATSFARGLGVEHLILHKDDLENEAFAANPPDRCFHCKDKLFERVKAVAAGKRLDAVFDGSNADDLRDYRPGIKAAVCHEVRSPLAECGFSKEEIRAASRSLGLSTWDRPSSPCLSSRFPYGTRITAEALARVGRAEEFLHGLGLRDLRVRDHGDTARIEVPEDAIGLLMEPETRRRVVGRLRSLGYAFVSLDLEGFRSGSMNRTLDRRDAEYSLSETPR